MLVYNSSGSVITNYKADKKDGPQIMRDANDKEVKLICWIDDKMCPDKNPPFAKENPYKGWKSENFKNGKLKRKYLLHGFGDYQESYTYFDNGVMAYSYRRKHKGQNFNPDIYEFIALDDRGREVAKGDCYLGVEDFYGEDCYDLTGLRISYDEDGKVYSKASDEKGERHGDSWYFEDEAEKIIAYEKGIKKRLLVKKGGKIIQDESYHDDGSIKK